MAKQASTPMKSPRGKTAAVKPAAPVGRKKAAADAKPLNGSKQAAEMSGGAPAPAGVTDEVSRQGIRLGFLIHDVSRLRRAAYDQLMKPLNITRARWWVLAHLSRHDGMMQSQLADVLEVGKASLGTVIEQLEIGGWVERRSDPSDKRAKRVFLTKAAQALIKRMTTEEDRFNARILAELSPDDRAALLRHLTAVKLALSQVVSDRAAPLDDED